MRDIQHLTRLVCVCVCAVHYVLGHNANHAVDMHVDVDDVDVDVDCNDVIIWLIEPHYAYAVCAKVAALH